MNQSCPICGAHPEHRPAIGPHESADFARGVDRLRNLCAFHLVHCSLLSLHCGGPIMLGNVPRHSRHVQARSGPAPENGFRYLAPPSGPQLSFTKSAFVNKGVVAAPLKPAVCRQIAMHHELRSPGDDENALRACCASLRLCASAFQTFPFAGAGILRGEGAEQTPGLPFERPALRFSPFASCTRRRFPGIFPCSFQLSGLGCVRWSKEDQAKTTSPNRSQTNRGRKA